MADYDSYGNSNDFALQFLNSGQNPFTKGLPQQPDIYKGPTQFINGNLTGLDNNGQWNPLYTVSGGENQPGADGYSFTNYGGGGPITQGQDSAFLKYAMNPLKYGDAAGLTYGPLSGRAPGKLTDRGIDLQQTVNPGISRGTLESANDAAPWIAGAIASAGASGMFSGGAAVGEGAGAGAGADLLGEGATAYAGAGTDAVSGGGGWLDWASNAGGDMFGNGADFTSGAANIGADSSGGAMDMFGSQAYPGGGSNTIFGTVPGEAAAGGLSAKDFAVPGVNALVNMFLASQNRKSGQAAADRSDALLQQQRAPFQQAATDMVQNPQNYFQNNPFATSMANFYRNNVIPTSIAKSGNTGFDTDRLGAQFATALGGNYNQLLQTLMTGGGFNQGTGYAGTNLMQGEQAANQNIAEAFRGLGGVTQKAAESIFGSPDQPKTPTANPVTGSYTVVG